MSWKAFSSSSGAAGSILWSRGDYKDLNGFIDIVEEEKDSLPFCQDLHHVWHKLEQLHLATGVLHFSGGDDLVDLLFGGNAAQESQDGSNFTDIDRFVANVIEDAEGVGDPSLQVIGDLH